MYTQKQKSLVIAAFRNLYNRTPSPQEINTIYQFDISEFEKVRALGACNTFEEYFGEEDGLLDDFALQCTIEDAIEGV